MNSIFHHVSIRKYKNQPVEKEKILRILKAGMQSPSAWNQQPWEFYVVTNKEMKYSASAIINKERLSDYSTNNKNTIRFALHQDLPIELIKEIIQFRIQENLNQWLIPYNKLKFYI